MKNFFTSTKSYVRHHKKRAIIALIILVILTIIFWPRPPKPLETQTADRTDITQSISATGTVNSLTSVTMNFLINGKLVYVGAKEGDMVKKWQTIVALDQRSVQKTLEDKLLDYSLKRNTFDQTQYNNQNRTPAQALNDTMMRILQDNQYDLDKAVISVQLQSLVKEQSLLVSPIAGIVIEADVTTPGVNITTATNYTVADPDNLVFQMDIDEADVGKVKIGQNVRVTLDAFPDKTLDLTIKDVDFASHTTDSGGNAYTVDVTLPQNTNRQYRIGLNGDGEVIVAQKKNVVVVSLASLTDDGSVYVKKGETFEKRKVRTGIQSDTEIEILDGVSPGDEVALQPDEVVTFLQNEKKNFF